MEPLNEGTVGQKGISGSVRIELRSVVRAGNGPIQYSGFVGFTECGEKWPQNPDAV